MDTSIFLQVSVILAVTVSVAFIIRLLRQPLLVAYLIAGIISGPLVLDLLGGDSALFRAFAEFGIVLLLFVVGLNLGVASIRTIGRAGLIGGIIQFLFTGAVGYLLLRLLPLPDLERIYLAVAVTFSSTIVIVKLLTDKGHAQRLYGRQAIGLMVVQDIIAVLLLIVVSTLDAARSPAAELTRLTGIGALTLAAVALCARFLLPPLLRTAARSGEYLFLTSVAWCFAVAATMRAAGFSLEIGALIAGISLGSSPFQLEIESRIRPLRDFFLVLFFIILGSQMQFTGFRDAIVPGLLLSAFILVGNPLILWCAYRALGFTRRNSFLIGLTAAQVSEFGFVLLALGIALGHIPQGTLSVFTLTALVTFVASTYLITYGDRLYRHIQPALRWLGPDRRKQEEPKGIRYDAWLFGYHRLGWKIAEEFRERSVPFAVVDDNPAAIAKLAVRAIPAHYGDATDVDFLDELPLVRTKLIISTIPDPHDQRMLIRHLRHRGCAARIIATAEHAADLPDLYTAGADFVMMPHLLGGAWMADVLNDRPWTARTFAALRAEQHAEMQLRHAAQTHA